MDVVEVDGCRLWMTAVDQVGHHGMLCSYRLRAFKTLIDFDKVPTGPRREGHRAEQQAPGLCPARHRRPG